ncbi:nucleotidyltransferase [Bacillus sp. FSL K6-3431]|uniref:nucleotidyltransferase n=1 Tax=Bacillus sp. FSL K6-3431 TaxID=2921500 RepID=UPI0030F82EA1
MRSAGVVVEYNPFHNGHNYHIQETKRKSQADVIIAVMSGNFLQRGEPALVSKWSRTKMALKAGADIIIELPYAFAVQKAETFAYGSVFLLNALKCNTICFGSERGDLLPFIRTLHFLEQHKEDYDDWIHSYMKEGLSYPTAASNAYKRLDPPDDLIDLSKPNNILGFHYLSAAANINKQIEFITINRQNADYHDEDFQHATIASATAIRKSLQQHSSLDKVRSFMPDTTYSELATYKTAYGQFHDWENYWPYLQYQLLTIDADELRTIYEVEEGIENRLIKAARQAESFLAFMQMIKTKRYTWTRLQRLCTHILCNCKKSDINKIGKNPSYIRLLGMSEAGRIYLNQVKKDLPIPLIAKVSAFPKELLQLDLKAANVYTLGLSEPERSKLFKLEFEQPPIYFDSAKQ